MTLSIDAQKIHPDIRDEQLKEFIKEQESFSLHRKEAAVIIKNEVPEGACVLILDVSQGAFNPDDVKDQGLVDLLMKSQFGGGPLGHGSAFRALLGFEKDDPRVVVWDVAKNPEGQGLPTISEIDAFITTGGPAMPSELIPGNETKNTPWLQAAVNHLKSFWREGIPGANFCLGHQLWNHAMGAQLGKQKAQREFGTVRMRLNSEMASLRLLDGVAEEDGSFLISSSHSEGVKVPASYKGVEQIVANDYYDFQGFAFPIGGFDSVKQADEQDQLIISIQNHPELLGLCLEVLRRLRRDAIAAEGFDIDRMIFRDTPTARRLFLNFLKMIGRRANRRLSQSTQGI